MAEIRPQVIAECAQRLWVLERVEERSGRHDAFRFIHAIAVLGEAVVRIGFVRSWEAHRSTQGCLATPRVRRNLDRNAGFRTLDQAMAWADSKKLVWLSQGWTEFHQDSCDLEEGC